MRWCSSACFAFALRTSPDTPTAEKKSGSIAVPYAVHLVPEVELEALVPNESLDEAVDIVMRTLRRVQHGDGYISIAPLAHCYRVSTGNPQL